MGGRKIAVIMGVAGVLRKLVNILLLGIVHSVGGSQALNVVP